MKHDQNMITTLRAQVIEILEQAGYRNSEAALPAYPAAAPSARLAEAPA